MLLKAPGELKFVFAYTMWFIGVAIDWFFEYTAKLLI